MPKAFKILKEKSKDSSVATNERGFKFENFKRAGSTEVKGNRGGYVKPPIDAPKAPAKSIRKETTIVSFHKEGYDVPMMGVIDDTRGSTHEISLVIPNSKGDFVRSEEKLLVAKDEVIKVGTELRDGVVRYCKSAIKMRPNASSEIKDGEGNIIDYRNVSFEGYGSTFGNPEMLDRDGEYIMEGAFDESIRLFRENPVMLTDHERSVANLVGHYSKVVLDPMGLALRGEITNSPDEYSKRVRFLVMEGSLKTMSIGGGMFYSSDWRGIEEVQLYETSLVTVPANPEATFVTRSLNEEVAQKMYKHYTKHYKS